MMKAMALLSILSRSPGEFMERSSTIFRARWESLFIHRQTYPTTAFREGVNTLVSALGHPGCGGLREADLNAIEAEIARNQARLPTDAPFGKFHNGDVSLGRLCYLTATVLQPSAIVETGVCYGVTSSYLLHALDFNDKGQLYSIDLPPLGKNADDYVGWFVPRERRERWDLRRGTSARLLGPLLAELGQIDLFIHDSLHTYSNMKMELSLAWSALRRGGVLIADDIEGNRAFAELANCSDVAFSVIIMEEVKDSLLGVAVKRA